MQNRIKIMRFCNAVIADLYEKSNLKKSWSRRRNFLRQVKSTLADDGIVLPVRKWYKVAKRIIEIIAPGGLQSNIKN